MPFKLTITTNNNVKHTYIKRPVRQKNSLSYHSNVNCSKVAYDYENHVQIILSKRQTFDEQMNWKEINVTSYYKLR